MASFVSSSDLEAARDEKRLARKKLLEGEETKFLAKQEAKRRHKESGNDRWMLPGIEKRLQTEATKFHSIKKHKKSKKKKKKKENSSECSDNSDSEEQWEEKLTPSDKHEVKPKEHTNWLNFDDIVSGEKTYTSQSIKEQKEAEKAAQREKDNEVVGQHPRELNPYWKDGGKGLPSEEKKSQSNSNKIHKQWLLRSLRRMTEQAKEQGKSVESIAAERYGSWQDFQRLLRQASPERHQEKSYGHGYSRGQSDSKKSGMKFMRPKDDDNDDRYGYSRGQSDSKTSGVKFMRPKEDDNDDRYSRHSHRQRDSERRQESKRDKKDYRPSWKKSGAESPKNDKEGDSRSEMGSRSPRRRSPNRPSWKKTRSESAGNNESLHNRSPRPKRPRDQSSTKQDTTDSGPDGNKSSKKENSTNITGSTKSNNDRTERILGPNRLSPVPVLESSSLSSSSNANKVKETDVAPKPLRIEESKIKPEKTRPKPVVLSEKEKNQLGAKLLKAELMGNEKLAKTLETKLEGAWAAETTATDTPKVVAQEAGTQRESASESSEEETVVLTRVGKDGQSWPLQHSEIAHGSLPNKRQKKTKVLTHDKEGTRERYFADDDRHSLQDLVRREKMEEAEDQDAMFSRLASSQFRGTDSEYFTLDDKYVSEASRQNTRTEEEARQKQKAISEHKKLARRLEKCTLCFGNPELPKHLLIAIGKKCYLALPANKPLTEGHCIVVPMHHCSTGTGLDEDVWTELRQFMRSLLSMFRSREMDCVFMQTCLGLKKSRHFFIDCIPLPLEEGDMAPIYFKKAIQDCESEWSHNKKLIDTRGKDVRRCVPKGLPYFCVDFGMDGGFAHVVEDEAVFPFYFGREIVGGMLDVEPRLWRHPPKDHFSEQTKRSVQFSEWWKPHDWTTDISGTS